VGKTYPEIDPQLAGFLREQHLFFVATAPLSATGRVNLSPKGLPSLVVLDPHTVAYLDLTGSGVETIAHLRENGRITLMFCAFQGPPKIVRLHGRGEVIEPGDSSWEELQARFPSHPGARAVIRVRVERISDSCGYAVPLLRHEGDRDQLDRWCERKGPEGLEAYRVEHNRRSIDGLPGLARVSDTTPASGAPPARPSRSPLSPQGGGQPEGGTSLAED
jgi:hypothetical protein